MAADAPQMAADKSSRSPDIPFICGNLRIICGHLRYQDLQPRHSIAVLTPACRRCEAG